MEVFSMIAKKQLNILLKDAHSKIERKNAD